MKKVMIAAALASLISGSAMAEHGGTIHFTGLISENGCSVNTQTTDSFVDLGTVQKSVFTAANQAAGQRKSFNIELQNCPASVTTAQVTFKGPEDSAAPGVLALDGATSVATGVGIQLYEGQTPLALNTASSTHTVSATSHDATLQFVADYISTAATVTAGEADANTEFDLTYN